MLPWKKRRRELKEFDDLIEASSLGSPAARQIRSLTTDEDMERFRKQLARRDRVYRGQIGIGLLFLTLIMLILGVGDVFDDQYLHAALSGISLGIFLITAIASFKLSSFSSATVYLMFIIGLLFQSVRLALRGSWWAGAVEIVALILILLFWHRSRKPTQRK